MARSGPGIIAEVPVRDAVGRSGAETSASRKGSRRPPIMANRMVTTCGLSGAIWRVGAIRRNDDGSGPPCGW